jgi:hypothetical protein
MLTPEQWSRAKAIQNKYVGIIPLDLDNHTLRDAYPSLFEGMPLRRAQVTELYLLGLCTRAIGHVLGMAYSTVQNHVKLNKRLDPKKKLRGVWVMAVLRDYPPMVPVALRPTHFVYQRRARAADFDHERYRKDRAYFNSLGYTWYRRSFFPIEKLEKIKAEQAKRREIRKADRLAKKLGLDLGDDQSSTDKAPAKT